MIKHYFVASLLCAILFGEKQVCALSLKADTEYFIDIQSFNFGT